MRHAVQHWELQFPVIHLKNLAAMKKNWLTALLRKRFLRLGCHMPSSSSGVKLPVLADNVKSDFHIDRSSLLDPGPLPMDWTTSLDERFGLRESPGPEV